VAHHSKIWFQCGFTTERRVKSWRSEGSDLTEETNAELADAAHDDESCRWLKDVT